MRQGPKRLVGIFIYVGAVSLLFVWAARTGPWQVFVVPALVIFGFPLMLFVVLWALEWAEILPGGRSPTACPKCDYELKGNVSGICSECGTRVPGYLSNT